MAHFAEIGRRERERDEGCFVCFMGDSWQLLGVQHTGTLSLKHLKNKQVKCLTDTCMFCLRGFSDSLFWAMCCSIMKKGVILGLGDVCAGYKISVQLL